MNTADFPPGEILAIAVYRILSATTGERSTPGLGLAVGNQGGIPGLVNKNASRAAGKFSYSSMTFAVFVVDLLAPSRRPARTGIASSPNLPRYSAEANFLGYVPPRQ